MTPYQRPLRLSWAFLLTLCCLGIDNYQASAARTLKQDNATSPDVEIAVAQISSAKGEGAFTCALKNNGTYCWGVNDFGQLGNGASTASATPSAVVDSSSFAAIFSGEDHACALSRNGTAFCWGGTWKYNSTSAEYDLVDAETTAVPTIVPSNGPWLQLDAAGSSTCGITLENNKRVAYCWGDNHDGKLGIGSLKYADKPTKVATDDEFLMISCGIDHTCGILASNGSLACWGINIYGQLGIGSNANRTVPTLVKSDAKYNYVSCGWAITCARRDPEGTVDCFGDNESGTLGNNDTNMMTSTVPVAVHGNKTFATVAVGSYHVCGIDVPQYEAWCWGSNDNGQLGAGSLTAFSAKPLKVFGGYKWRAITVGGDGFTCGLTVENVAYCWGNSTDGRLGSKGNDTNIPRALSGGTGWGLANVQSSADIIPQLDVIDSTNDSRAAPPSSSPSPNSSSGNSTNVGAIVGGVVGGIAALGAAAGGFVYWRKRQNNKAAAQSEDSEMDKKGSGGGMDGNHYYGNGFDNNSLGSPLSSGPSPAMDSLNGKQPYQLNDSALNSSNKFGSGDTMPSYGTDYSDLASPLQNPHWLEAMPSAQFAADPVLQWAASRPAGSLSRNTSRSSSGGRTTFSNFMARLGSGGRRFQMTNSSKKTMIDSLIPQHVKHLEFQWSDIRVLRLLGSGSFGKVYLVQLHHTLVALKMLVDTEEKKNMPVVMLNLPSDGVQQQGGGISVGASTTGDLSPGTPGGGGAVIAGSQALQCIALANETQLIDEVCLMEKLRHNNVALLVGFCLDPPCLALEYYDRGSLFDILQQGLVDSKEAAQLTWERRLNMAADAAAGMMHLATRSPPVVHRDLKSPNLLVSKEWKVKIADMGLSRLVTENPNIGSRASTTDGGGSNPRWLAPEVLSGSPHNTSTDVYSFGMVLFEILTFQLPWGALHTWGIVGKVQSGGRPEIPPIEQLPGFDTKREPLPVESIEKYIGIMERCWAQNPEERPSFETVAAELRALADAYSTRNAIAESAAATEA